MQYNSPLQKYAVLSVLGLIASGSSLAISIVIAGEPAAIVPTDDAMEELPVEVQNAMEARRQAMRRALSAHTSEGQSPLRFKYDWSMDLADLSSQIKRTNQRPMRQALFFSYLDLGFGGYGAELDPRIVREALDEITPTSYLWAIDPDLIGVAIRSIGERAQADDYVRDVIRSHPDSEVRRIVRSRFSPDRSIMPGKPVPDFSFPILGDKTKSVTRASLLGRIYLLDFWATFCPPCIEEMTNFHTLYPDYSDRSFEIVSLNLDSTSDTALSFLRKKNWRLPWVSARVEGGLNNERVKKQFEISGLPKPILVDEKGIILATRMDLRGPRLSRTLLRVFRAQR